MKAIDIKALQNRNIRTQSIRQNTQRVKPRKRIICVKTESTAHVWAVDINSNSNQN